MSTLRNKIEIPQFWESVEKSLSMNPDEIKEIKEILTIFKYTTVDSIIKFAKHKEINFIELEFLSRKQELTEMYPHLREFTFASGFYSTLKDIALKIKKHYVQEHTDVDLNRILEKVVTEAKKVWLF